MSAMSLVPADHPLMKAWTAYQESDDFKNSLGWALALYTIREEGKPAEPRADHVDGASDNALVNPVGTLQREQHVKGSLWAAFLAGFSAATERAASLHESINPASDDERHNKVPGAGAMGAVIEYRDTIRAPR